MSGLSVDITSDTRQFQAQVDDVSDQLSKVSDQLDQTTASGDKAGPSIESAMRTAQESTAASDTVFRQNTQTFQQGYASRVQTTELSEGEINRVQKESLKTGAAAISAQVAQAAQGFDGTVQGALSSITNIGAGIAAFGGPEIAAAAGGIALLASFISGAFQKSAADTAALEADVSSMTATLEKLGITGVTGPDAVNTALEKMSTTTDGSQQDLDAAKKTADQAGLSFKGYADALAGNTSEQKKLYAQVTEMQPVIAHQIELSGQQGSAYYGQTNALIKQQDALTQAQTALKAQNDTLGQSKTRLDDYNSALEGSDGASPAAVAAQKKITAAIKTTDDLIVTAAQDTADFYDGKTQKYDVAAYIAQMTAAAQSIQETASFLISAPLSASSKAFIQAQTPQIAAGMIAAYKQATPAQQAALNAQYGELGTQAGDKFNTQLATQLAIAPTKPVTIPVVADPSSFNRTIKQLQNGYYQVAVNGKFGRPVT